MGCWSKYVKPVVRELRDEITKEALTAAGRIVRIIDPAIADGKLTKIEAGSIAAATIKEAFGLTMGAAIAVVTIAVRTFTERHAGIDPSVLNDEEDDGPPV